MKLLFPLFLFLFACHNKPTQAKGDAVKDESNAGELTDIFKEYVQRYTTTVLIDSVFTSGADNFHLRLKHYCLMDSGIVVPGGYVYMYKLDSFVTHNFVSQVRLDRNGKTIYSGTVSKKDFEKFLEFPLRRYGALLSPQIHYGNGEIDLDYRISIPLTDVGVGVTMVVDRNGGVGYNNRQ